MAIDQIGAADGSKSALGKSKLAESFDTFLVMLTTQLKHQDPLSPMDSTQFTNQLVQFANVEQQINANSNLEALIGLNQINQQVSAIGYIGRHIEAASGLVPLQDGKAAFSYTLGEEARAASVVVKDMNGKIVANLPGKTESGRHEMTWDGKDDNGKQLEDGSYVLEVVATNAENKAVDSVITVYGRVTDVSSDGKETLVNMNGVVVPLEWVLTVRENAAVQSGSSNNSGTGTSESEGDQTSEESTPDDELNN